LLITHDLVMAKFLCDRVLVMYLVKIVEELPASALPAGAKHPYSKLLMASVPDLFRTEARIEERLKGEVPSAVTPPSGCRFHTRCPYAQARCTTEEPVLRAVGDNGQRAACHFL